MSVRGCRNFQAYLDKTPGGPPQLRVSGECEVEDSRFGIELRPMESQSGVVRRFTCVRVEESEIGTPAFTWKPVSYSEDADRDYSEVWLDCCNLTIDVKVIS